MLPSLCSLESHESWRAPDVAVYESRQSSMEREALTVSVTTPANKSLSAVMLYAWRGVPRWAKCLVVVRLFEVTGVWQIIRIYTVPIHAQCRHDETTVDL